MKEKDIIEKIQEAVSELPLYIEGESLSELTIGSEYSGVFVVDICNYSKKYISELRDILDEFKIKPLRVKYKNGTKNIEEKTDEFVEKLVESDGDIAGIVYLYSIDFECRYDASDCDGSLDSICETIQIMMSNVGFESEYVTGIPSFNDDDYLEFSDDSSGYKYCGDYTLLHGDEYLYDSDYDEYVDARCYSCSNEFIDDFWNFTIKWVREYYDMYDPVGLTGVYTRKGKDWYITRAMYKTEVVVPYFDESLTTDEVYDEEEFCEFLWWHSSDTVQFTVDNISKFTKSVIKEQQKRGEFETMVFSLADDVHPNMRDCILEILELDVETIEDGLQAQVCDNLILCEKYRHLQMLKTYASKNMAKLVYTSAVGNGSGKKTYAIKMNGEEYHFFLEELYKLGGNYKKIFNDAVESITNRLRQKEEVKNLIEKSKKVFVSFEDSVKSGNCKAGTELFCKKYGIDLNKIGGVRGDLLFECEISSFTKRAVSQALKRRGIK